MPRPTKRVKLLSDVENSDSGEDEGVKLPNGDAEPAVNGFKINEEYAKRFEHNKKREEKQRLEEKFSGSGNKRGRPGDDDVDGDSEEEDSEEDETEDDDADLATETLDREIMDTLQAIRNKDPRVYDKNIKFYREFDTDGDAATEGGEAKKKEKPMYLQDYHRQNLMAGHAGVDDDAEDEKPPVQTYQQEQDKLKRELVGSMHASAKTDEVDGEASDEEDDFLVAKSRPKHDTLPAATTTKAKQLTENDIAAADKDPESYLSNFMAARAWLPTDGSRFEAFDSDDSDEEKRADEFEEAYNMRFEDPKTANEKLQSFARDVGKYGVRREEKSGRKKARESERERKEREKAERQEDRARLRRLRIEEVEEKVNRIKEAAGLEGQEMDLEQWRDVIEGDFDDDQWDAEMKRRFGEQYYADKDGDGEEGSDEDSGSKKRKAKKPKWDDDIDINDLVPDFEGEDSRPNITLTDDEEDVDGGAPLPPTSDEEQPETQPGKKRTSKKDRLQARADAKRVARKQRRQIEEMVDSSLPLDHPALAGTDANAPPSGFRYRETSPTNFGLSARDILFADDSQLNQYAGLKKLHGFRDEEKKRRDKKKFSKKARLREWRKEAFGAPDEPSGGFERVLGHGFGVGLPRGDGDVVMGGDAGGMKVDVREGGDASSKKKRKRTGKKKKAAEV